MAELVEVICISNMPYIGGEGFNADRPLGNLTVGKKYKASREEDWLRVWDDYDEDYLYPARMFNVVRRLGS
jgi:hypothetical protein